MIDSALKEFWHKHPELYGDYMYLLGHRISQMGAGTLDQDEYIAEWKEKKSPSDKAINEAMKKRNEESPGDK